MLKLLNLHICLIYQNILIHANQAQDLFCHKSITTKPVYAKFETATNIISYWLKVATVGQLHRCVSWYSPTRSQLQAIILKVGWRSQWC